MPRAKLAALKPRVAALGGRLPVHSVATPRDRGRPWRRRRAAWLQVHPLCATCEAKGTVTAATEVDHVIPLWKGGADDDSNLQSLCAEDHEAKTSREASEMAGGG